MQLLSLNISDDIDGYEVDYKSHISFSIEEYLSKSNIKSYTILSGFIDNDDSSCGIKSDMYSVSLSICNISKEEWDWLFLSEDNISKDSK